MGLFNKWCNEDQEVSGDKILCKLTEQSNGRKNIAKILPNIIRSHYDELKRIAEDITENGFVYAAQILKERLPREKKARSGELGEILATEFVEEYLSYTVPVKRLRYKDGREVALRGDDFIGVNNDNNDLKLLKGESKSRLVLSSTVLTEAREALNRNNGRCTPSSLLFVVDRLLDEGGNTEKLGKILRKEVGTSALSPEKICHALFTLSGNMPLTELRNDLAAADDNRPQRVVNIHISDHQQFIKKTYEEAGNLGIS